MTADPQAARIAEGLTEAQRDSLRGRFSYGDPIEADEGERAMYRFGLWAKDPRDRNILTPLGLAVRAHLQGGAR